MAGSPKAVKAAQVEIRALRGLDEFRECERIQETIWGGLSAASEILAVAQRFGGAVIGAVTGGRVVGFLFAFLARHRGRLIHWSHIMAVVPGYRDLGLGFRMKLAHRKIALRQGLRSICWTYDPLQSRNATLNLARLGASAEEYCLDFYGHFPSLIEKGLASDRFVMNWRIGSMAVARRLRDGAAAPRFPNLPRVNETRPNAKGFLENTRIHFDLRERRLLVEIPSNTDPMREQALDLARRWRMETRKIFQHAMRRGYRVRDFLPPGPATGEKCFYLLEL